MKNAIRIVAATGLIIGAGLVHGAWTNRWGTPPALAELAGRLKTLPTNLGEWSAVDRQLGDAELTMTGAVGYISRIYSNPNKGLAVSILLLTGLPGNIATHTPDACYPGAGYSLGEAELYSLTYGPADQSAQFRTAVAAKGGANPSVLRIFWSWRGTKGWSAPEEARWTLAGEPMLTKLYVVRETGSARVDPKNDPCNEFMTLLLPEIDRLIPEAGRSAKASAATSKN